MKYLYRIIINYYTDVAAHVFIQNGGQCGEQLTLRAPNFWRQLVLPHKSVLQNKYTSFLVFDYCFLRAKVDGWMRVRFIRTLKKEKYKFVQEKKKIAREPQWRKKLFRKWRFDDVTNIIMAKEGEKKKLKKRNFDAYQWHLTLEICNATLVHIKIVFSLFFLNFFLFLKNTSNLYLIYIFLSA